MKPKRKEYLRLPMRFQHGLLKYTPHLPSRQREDGEGKYVLDAGWWKTLLKVVAIAVAWAGLVLILRSFL